MIKKGLVILLFMGCFASVSYSQKDTTKQMNGFESKFLGLKVSGRKQPKDTINAETFSVLNSLKPSVIKEAYRLNKEEALQKMQEDLLEKKDTVQKSSAIDKIGWQFKNYFGDNTLGENNSFAIALPWIMVLFFILCYRAAKIFKRIEELDAYGSPKADRPANKKYTRMVVRR